MYFTREKMIVKNIYIEKMELNIKTVHIHESGTNCYQCCEVGDLITSSFVMTKVIRNRHKKCIMDMIRHLKWSLEYLDCNEEEIENWITKLIKLLRRDSI